MIPSVTNRGNEQALDTWATHCAAGDMAESSVYLLGRIRPDFLPNSVASCYTLV